MKIRVLLLGACAFTSTYCGLAKAQTSAGAASVTPNTGKNPDSSKNKVEEVVVTAERRTRNLQRTPIAATVLTAADLRAAGVTTIDQLQFVSPSLTVNNFGQGNDVDIRGIGKGEHNTQTGTGVVTYRDGVASFPGYFQEEPYYDIASVEVLRGPQGTFNGQNSTGGAVIVNTNDPAINGGYHGYLFGHYGNYNDTGLQGAINLPISDTLAARIAFNGEYRNSFYNIKGLDQDSDVRWGSTRVSVLWKPTEDFKVLFKTDYNYLNNGGYFGDAIINPVTGKVNPLGSNLFNFANNYGTYAVDQFVRSSVKADYTLGDGITLQSISAYQRGRTGWKGDIDGTNFVPPSPYPNYIIAERSDETLWSQEVNIISPTKGLITWVVGGYYDHNRYDFPPTFVIGVPPGGFDEDLTGVNFTHTVAGFGQASLNLPDGFQIQAGLRYSSWTTTNKTFYFVPEYAPLFNQPQDETERGNNLTGKVTLNWQVDPANFLYAFAASGAKPGGLNTSLYSYPPVAIPGPFRQEYVYNYEIGWKSRLFDDHLHTQLGAYYNDFKHFQVSIPLPNNPQFSTEVNNPNATKLYGFEASAQAVFGGWSTDMSLGIEHSSLGTFFAQDPRFGVSGTCNANAGPATATCLNLGGNTQTYAPNFTIAVGSHYDYAMPNGDVLTPGVTFSHQSHQWGTLFENVAAGDDLTPRNVLGASLTYTHQTWVGSLYATNLTDDHYISALLPPIRIAGAPRQYGFSLLKSF